MKKFDRKKSENRVENAGPVYTKLGKVGQNGHVWGRFKQGYS